MRRFLILFVCIISLLAVYSCHNNGTSGNDSSLASQNLVNIPASASNNTNGKIPKIVFTDTSFDFGTIKEGDKVTHIFTFKNEGQGDLVIASATAGCGCTKPSFAHVVKHPGDTGTISVTFDSSNKSGKVQKSISVTSNSQPSSTFLIINANIQPSNN